MSITAADKPVNKRIGKNVRLVMQLREKSQTELASILGLTESTLSRRIRGITDWTPDEIMKAAQALNVEVWQLFAELLPDLDSDQEPLR